jgi:uncharacterized protein (TIGR03435 family)
LLGVILLVSSVLDIVKAQGPRHAFEVASIRRDVTSGPKIGIARGNSFHVTRTTLRDLVLMVYEVREDQLIGGPDWVRNDLFEIIARAAQEVTRGERLSMVRTLLEERFGLVMNQEQRDSDVYVLKLARADGRIGPDLRQAGSDCELSRPVDPLDRVATLPRPSSGARPSFVGTCATIEDIVSGPLSNALNTTVIDQTGLTGKWDYVVAHSGVTPSPILDRPPTDDRPPLFTALQEQLGLKLEKQRGFKVIWVIKSVHPPTEN